MITGECKRGDPATIDDRSLHDLRYFYVDEKGFGDLTCRIALESMMSTLRKQGVRSGGMMQRHDRITLSRSSNPIVRGFLAKQICLSTIATNKGLRRPTAVDPKLGRTSFQPKPAFAEFLSTGHGVILLLDRASKQSRDNISQIHSSINFCLDRQTAAVRPRRTSTGQSAPIW